MTLHSVRAVEMATWAWSMERRCAATAPAYAQGSRRTKSGWNFSHAASTVPSIASVESRPKNSPSKSRAAWACGSRAARRHRSFDFDGSGGSLK